MSITAEQKAHVINLLKKKYVDWEGFDHQAFRRDEINFKRSTVKKAVSFLSESKLAQLLVTRDTEAFIDRLEHIGKANPLLKSTDVSNGDLEILYVPTLDKPVFCAQVYHLLHGTEPVVERLGSYLEYIEAHELPNTWTFPTYLLQFCYPDTEFFVMPRPTEWFLKYIGLSPTLGRPTPDTYAAIREFAHSLKYALAEYRPQDMIDIQSVIHVCSMMSEPAYQGINGYDDDSMYQQSNKEFERQFGVDVAEEAEEQSWPGGESYDSDSTMLYISEVSDESHTEVRLANGHSPDMKALYGNGSKGEGNTLPELFKRFVTKYMVSPAGVARAAAYAKAREQAEQNFAHLIAEHELGEKVTDRVFLHLLPHSDTERNQNHGAWIHPVYESAENLMLRLDKKFAAQPDIREQVGHVLLEFIRHCVYKSHALDRSSEALSRLDALSLMDVSSITPILHALKPTQYMLLHENAVNVLNKMGDQVPGVSLTSLPEINTAGLQFVKELKLKAQVETIPSVHDTDLFDIFTHWYAETQNQTEAPPPAPPAPEISASPPPAYARESRSVQQPQFRPQSQSHPQPQAPQSQSKPQGPAYSPHEEEENSIEVVLEPETENGEYSLEDCAEETGFSVETLQQWLNTLERKRQIIFYGPSGTGKTFMAQRIARGLTNGTDGIVQLIQFHAGYTYEKFIGTGQKPGDFHTFCTKAAQRTGPSVLIIDEINRTDLGAVFGELLAQLDRATDNTMLIKQQVFQIPENVFIIGTMVPGRPVGLFSDSVARRRFAMIPLMPNYEILEHFHRDTVFQVDGLIRTLNQINTLVENPRYQIGITYFLRKDLHRHIEEIWRFEVEPCIEEAFYNDVEKVESFRWSKMKRRLTR